ncbi:MAG TPA: carboxypeptidase M32 [Gemmatimonadales bacterium]|jgi:carboxypeptidase Taq|nr:carboxypeptidase M32 [Gemmatimonadales bacterium]
MRPDKAYQELVQRLRDETLLTTIEALLEWDEETYMPAGGVANRSEQLAMIAGLLHERGTDPRLGELLHAVEASDLLADPAAPPAVNVRVLRRDYDRFVRLPRSLVEEVARTTSLAQQAWASAREAKDFQRFRPFLERIIALKRNEAECVGYAEEPYDALLEDYEPGLGSAVVARLFEVLRQELMPLAGRIAGAKRQPDASVLRRHFPRDGQRRFGEMVAAAVGFEFGRGRLDLGVHPSCSSIGPGDCRISVRFDDRDFAGGLLTILHEVGHGLYEQGLDPAHYGTPLGEAPSVGIDEAQARFWENRVGRDRRFWDHFYPRARELFPESLGDVPLEEFHFAVNRVVPSLIRVRADEVTYNLHIMIRFDLERALISGALSVADLSEAWRAAYRQILGVVPRTDAEGCLQDGHWADGLIGYFPTYTLGDVFAAQLFARAEVELGSLGPEFARGEFGALVQWLGRRVYRQGGRYPSPRLIEVVTGSPPDHRPLVRILKAKYEELYQL